MSRSSPLSSPGSKSLLAAAALMALGVSCSGRRQGKNPAPDDDPAKAAAALGEVAGAPVRMVWRDGRRLMGFDSFQAAPAVILREADGIECPLMGPDGATVVYTQGGKIHALTWPGPGEDRELADGFAVAVWRDPAAREDWIFAAPDASGGSLFRMALRDPTRREPVWEKGSVDPRSVHLSRDGMTFAAVFHGRDFGVADVKSSRWQKKMTQDNALLVSDNSFVSGILDGTRRRWRFFSPAGDPHDAFAETVDPPVTWQVALSSLPELSGSDARGTRWTNHPRFAAITVAGAEGGSIGIARFSPDLRVLEAAALLKTESRSIDQPAAWIGGGEGAALAAFPQSPPLEFTPDRTPDGRWIRWPVSFDNVHFSWKNDFSNNQIAGRAAPCRVTPIGTGRFDGWGSMRLDGGAFEGDLESARRFAAAAAEAGRFSVELVLSETIDDRVAFSTRLLAMELDSGQDAFSLSRVDQSLVLRVLLEPGSAPAQEYQAQIAPVAVVNNRAMHVSVSVVGGRVSWAIDGVDVPGDPDLGPPSLAAWRPDRVKRLVIGDTEPQGQARWKGRLDHLLLRTGELEWTEKRDNPSLALNGAAERTHVRPLRVRARAKSVAPAASLTGERRALVQQTYEVVQMISGEYDHPEIAVAHWAVMDGRPVANRPSEPGAEVELLVVPVRKFPQLESERIHLDGSEFRLPLYIDIATPDIAPSRSDEKK